MSAKIQKISKQVRVDEKTHRKLKVKAFDEGETITKLITRLLKPHLAEHEIVSTKNV